MRETMRVGGETRKQIEGTKSGIKLHYVYHILVLIRLAIVLIPHTSYLHPDEFFQSIEPMAGEVFDVESVRSWEFNVTFPIRSTFLIRLTVELPLLALKGISFYCDYWFDIKILTPYVLMASLRLVYFLISLINDYCIFKMCLLYGQNFNTRLITLGTSYTVLVYCTHTLSNSLEVALLSLLILLVMECMIKSDKVIYHNEFLMEKYHKSKSISERVNYLKLRRTLPPHSLRKCFLVATVTVIGIFNRPTFVGFAFPVVFFWLLRGLGSKYIGIRQFHERIFSFIICTIPAILTIVIVDSAYYSYLTAGEVGMLEISIDSFVVTPLNFLKYNSDPKNLAQHGTHPRWLHLLVNIPLLFNILGIIALIFGITVFIRISKGVTKSMPRVQTVDGMMFFTFLTPLIILSLFPHQEPRFLLPLVIPLVFSFSSFLQGNDSDSIKMFKLKRIGFVVWLTCNIIFTLFFGVVHQGGVFNLVRHFNAELKSKPRATTLHLITSHIYDIPQSLLLTENTSRLRVNRVTGHKYYLNKQIHLHEMRSKNMDEVVNKAKVVWDVSQATWESSRLSSRIYIALPSPLNDDLLRAWHNGNLSHLGLIPDKSFYPHWSAEASPSFPSQNNTFCINRKYLDSEINWSWDVKLTLFERLKCYFQQYSLQLYRIDKLFFKE